MTNLPHFTQVTFSDKMLALVVNSVNFAVVATGVHPSVRTPEGLAKGVTAGFLALSTVDKETWIETLTVLNEAANDIQDPSISAIKDTDENYPFAPEDYKLDSDPIESWDEYWERKGHRHPDDPRGGN